MRHDMQPIAEMGRVHGVACSWQPAASCAGHARTVATLRVQQQAKGLQLMLFAARNTPGAAPKWHVPHGQCLAILACSSSASAWVELLVCWAGQVSDRTCSGILNVEAHGMVPAQHILLTALGSGSHADMLPPQYPALCMLMCIRGLMYGHVQVM